MATSIMAPPPQKLRTHRPLRVGISPRQKPPPPDSIMLRSWVKNKLAVIPSTYSKYDEGMQAIKEQIQQDFFPQYHSLVMQAFYQEFYAIGVGSGETGEKLWARWRATHRDESEINRRSSSVYSTADIEDAVADPQYPEPSSLQSRRAALTIPAGVGRSIDAAKERQIRTSVLISEAEAKLLQNRDSNYWGDLAIPAMPQTSGKAKIVYIPSKSARNTVNIEGPGPSADSNTSMKILSRSESNGSYRRNSLPTRTSDDDNVARDIIRNISELETRSKARGAKSTASTQHSPAAILYSKDAAVHLPTAQLSLKKSYDDKSLLKNISASASTTRSHNDLSADDTGTFGRNTKRRAGSNDPRGAESAYSRSEQSYPYTPTTGDIFSDATKHREGMGLRMIDSPLSVSPHLLPTEGSELASRNNGDGLGIRWRGHVLPVHKVYQGQGMLGTRTPVVSFMASPNVESPTTPTAMEEGKLYPPSQLWAIKQPQEYPIPTPPISRQSSPLSFYNISESNYSSSSRGSNNYLRNDQDSEDFNDYHQLPARDYSGHPLSSRAGRDAIIENGRTMFLNTETPRFQAAPENLSPKDPRLQGKSAPSLIQYQRRLHNKLLSNSAPATRNNSAEILRAEETVGGTPTHPEAPPKLRSRFSFVLPQMHLGSRIAAHHTRRRNSFQSPVLRVTKEIFREEEEHTASNPNRTTFTAHVPRFGKDHLKGIHKAYNKADAKKPVFLKVIQDAVHDSINSARKTSSKDTAPNIKALRTPIKQPVKINKLTISGPMHDGNPLKMSSSTSTSNVLLNATPIQGVSYNSPGTKPRIVLQSPPAALNPHGRARPQTELMPWELGNTPTSDEELVSGDDHESITDIKATQQAGKAISKSFDQPTITIDPFQQAALYSWIECTVVQACSDFLRQQQENLNLELLKKEIKKWRHSQVKLSTGETRPRDQPIEFMFGMGVQCKLLEGNHKTLHFSGPSAMNAIPVINAWKYVIPSFSPRTFCFPDYLILEHLRVLEKVLHLLGPAYWDSKMFEKKRAEIVKRIMETDQSQKAWINAEKMAKLQRDRERAEASLLQAVGIWSTEDSPTAAAFGGY